MTVSLPKTVRRDTIEYLEAIVVSASPGADVAATSLVGSDVRIGIGTTGDDTPSWLNADWVGTPTTTGLARTSSVVDFSTGNYPGRDWNVYIELTIGGETVIDYAYQLKIEEF